MKVHIKRNITIRHEGEVYDLKVGENQDLPEIIQDHPFVQYAMKMGEISPLTPGGAVSAEAKADADTIIKDATDKAAAIVAEAEEKAKGIIKTAEDEALAIMEKADADSTADPEKKEKKRKA